MLDEPQVSAIENILLDRSAVVESARLGVSSTPGEGRQREASEGENSRNLLGIDDQSRMRGPEIALQLGLNSSELAERGGHLFSPSPLSAPETEKREREHTHLAKNPCSSDVGNSQTERAVPSNRPTELDIEEDEIEGRFRDVGAVNESHPSACFLAHSHTHSDP
jgi:hypothetical protein